MTTGGKQPQSHDGQHHDEPASGPLTPSGISKAPTSAETIRIRALVEWISVIDHNRAIELDNLLHGRDLARDELLNALADCVAKATEYGSQDDGFVATYILPTGPLHRAIPLLQRYGITVRPGFDGRKHES